MNHLKSIVLVICAHICFEYVHMKMHRDSSLLLMFPIMGDFPQISP